MLWKRYRNWCKEQEVGVTAGWAQAKKSQRKWNNNAAEYMINLESAYNFPS